MQSQHEGQPYHFMMLGPDALSHQNQLGTSAEIRHHRREDSTHEGHWEQVVCLLQDVGNNVRRQTKAYLQAKQGAGLAS